MIRSGHPSEIQWAARLRKILLGSLCLCDSLRFEGRRYVTNRRRSEGNPERPLRPEASEIFMEPKRAHKLFHYKTKTTWSSARHGMLSAAGKPNIVVGSPPEFKGRPDTWAPEELLIGSLNTCMMLTFLTLAQAEGLTVVGYESEAEGLLENVEGKYHITEVTVRPRITLKSEAALEPARKSMESVEANCFIANSISARVTLAPEFVVASPEVSSSPLRGR
jgi:organic hydroperoxide reductase OsmC/OhrA